MSIRNKIRPNNGKQIISTICLLPLFAMILSSCGQLFQFDLEEITSVPISIDRKTVCIMEGDSCRLNVTFQSDSVENRGIYWLTDNINIAYVDADTLIGVGAGTVTINAMSVSQSTTDSCQVTVMPRWDAFDPTNFFFDMVVYANVTLNGMPIDTTMIVGAFVDDNLRGIGIPRKAHGKPYTEIRIYSEGGFITPEYVKFYLYQYKEARLYSASDSISFDGETYGSLSELREINFDNELK